MATVTFQLTAVPQEAVAQNQPPQNGTGIPSLNPNEAQGAPAEQDTVTLTTQTAQGQLTQQNQPQTQPPPPQEDEMFVAEAVIFGPPNAVNQANQAAPQNAAAQNQAVAPQSQQQVAAAPAANTPNAADPNAAGGFQTPQQQLSQLEQVLQQLGIDPQSISLFNQLALLPYVNDPAALQAFVQQLQGGSNQNATQAGAASNGTAAQANAQANAGTQNAATQTAALTDQVPQETQPQPAVQDSAGATNNFAVEFLFPEAQATTQGDTANQTAQSQPTQSQTPGPVNPPAFGPPNGLVAQFQELQVAFAIGGGDNSANPNGTNPAGGNAVNVTI